MSYTLYVASDVAVLESCLNAVKMIFGSADYQATKVGTNAFVPAVGAVGLAFTLMYSLASSVWRQQLDFVGLFVSMIVFMVLFVPQVDLDIEDVYTGQLTTVTDLPWGAVVPLALASQQSKNLTEKFTTAFQNVNGSANVTNSPDGLVTPLRSLFALRQIALFQNDVNAEATLNNYMEYCLRSNDGTPVDINAMFQSGDLVTWLTSNEPTAGTIQFDEDNPVGSNGVLVTCKSAGTYLKGRIDNFKTCKEAGCYGSQLNGIIGKVKGTANSTDYPGYALEMLSAGVVTDTQLSSFNAVMSTAMRKSMMTASSNSLDTAANMYNADVMERFRTQSALDAQMFTSTMFPTLSVLLFIYMAFMPIVVIVLFFQGMNAIKFMAGYLMIGMWTQTWVPVAAIINYYGQISINAKLLAMAASGTSVNPNKVFNMVSMDSFYDVIANQMAVTNNMLALTPMVTLALLTGSAMAMSRLADRATGGGAGVTGETTREISPGAVKEGATPVLGAMEKQGLGIGQRTAGVSSAVGERNADAFAHLDVGTNSRVSTGITQSYEQGLAGIKGNVSSVFVGSDAAQANMGAISKRISEGGSTEARQMLEWADQFTRENMSGVDLRKEDKVQIAAMASLGAKADLSAKLKSLGVGASAGGHLDSQASDSMAEALIQKASSSDRYTQGEKFSAAFVKRFAAESLEESKISWQTDSKTGRKDELQSQLQATERAAEALQATRAVESGVAGAFNGDLVKATNRAAGRFAGAGPQLLSQIQNDLRGAGSRNPGLIAAFQGEVQKLRESRPDLSELGANAAVASQWASQGSDVGKYSLGASIAGRIFNAAGTMTDTLLAQVGGAQTQVADLSKIPGQIVSGQVGMGEKVNPAVDANPPNKAAKQVVSDAKALDGTVRTNEKSMQAQTDGTAFTQSLQSRWDANKEYASTNGSQLNERSKDGYFKRAEAMHGQFQQKWDNSTPAQAVRLGNNVGTDFDVAPLAQERAALASTSGELVRFAGALQGGGKEAASKYNVPATDVVNAAIRNNPSLNGTKDGKAFLTRWEAARSAHDSNQMASVLKDLAHTQIGATLATNDQIKSMWKGTDVSSDNMREKMLDLLKQSERK